MPNILVTGVGSVMGHSIFDVLVRRNDPDFNIFLTNSEMEPPAALVCRELNLGYNFSLSPTAVNPEYKAWMKSHIEANSIDIIYPGTQHELPKLSELRDLDYPVACPGFEIVSLCSSKYSLAELFEADGVSHPKTRKWIKGESNIEDFIGFLAKPNSGSASRGIYLIDRRNQDSVKEVMDSSTIDYILQEFIEGNEYTCSVFLDKFSKDLSVLQLERTLSPDGSSLNGIVRDDEIIRQYLREIVEVLGRHGFDFGHLNVQLRLSKNGPQLFEINPRLSSTESPKDRLGFSTVLAYFSNIVLQEAFRFSQPKPGSFFKRYYSEAISIVE